MSHSPIQAPINSLPRTGGAGRFLRRQLVRVLALCALAAFGYALYVAVRPMLPADHGVGDTVEAGATTWTVDEVAARAAQSGATAVVMTVTITNRADDEVVLEPGSVTATFVDEDVPVSGGSLVGATIPAGESTSGTLAVRVPESASAADTQLVVPDLSCAPECSESATFDALNVSEPARAAAPGS